ncbi:hypothetical protein LKL35_33365 [Streptomyces sp. ET3-23]|uniref:hypothetical protein n=1 Tax=Streptomyces sp. ET3-23 TaxID=2885643 RepID=UPI001D0F7E83|nr:hypothetical protein [Streptomyces sp. ET3-23]MCC2280272.1 hypothetical protein [Streptomyces sp. ET3-23]
MTTDIEPCTASSDLLPTDPAGDLAQVSAEVLRRLLVGLEPMLPDARAGRVLDPAQAGRLAVEAVKAARAWAPPQTKGQAEVDFASEEWRQIIGIVGDLAPAQRQALAEKLPTTPTPPKSSKAGQHVPGQEPLW